MVLQQGQRTHVWGNAGKNEQVTVRLNGKTYQAVNLNGSTYWSVTLDPLPAGGPYTMTVEGDNTITVNDILVGDVWLCVGGRDLYRRVLERVSPTSVKDAQKEGGFEAAPTVRVFSKLVSGNIDMQSGWDRRWQVCSSKEIWHFPAVGYYFGIELSRQLKVPIGIIDCTTSDAEILSWIPRTRLENDPKYGRAMERQVQLKRQMASLKNRDAKETGHEGAIGGLSSRLNDGPGVRFEGWVRENLQYRIKGVICDPTGSNSTVLNNVVLDYPYADALELMITSWRDEWGVQEMPFYWVQASSFRINDHFAGRLGNLPVLREAQDRSLKLPFTGQVVAIDVCRVLFESTDTKRSEIANRLARLVLADTYKVPGIISRSPRFKSQERDKDKLVMVFNHLDGGWRPLDGKTPLGFVIAGNDGKFVAATAEVRADQRIEVWSESVPEPVSVRYAWADDPEVNLFNAGGLPLTPFRTDISPSKTN